MKRIWLLPVFAVAVTLAGCGPTNVNLDQLVAEQDARVGQHIVVAGRVVPIEEPDGTVSYVLEDDSQNRVLLVPPNVVEGYADSRVQVTGRFEFDSSIGRLLHVEEIHST